MNLKIHYPAFNKTELKKELTNLKKGCDKEINFVGSCWYISYQGNKRYCNKCKRRIKIIEEIIKNKELI